MTESEKLRRAWLAHLAVMCSPAFAKDATAALIAMLPDLADFGDHHFTAETRRHVACAPRRQSVPSYDEIVRALGDWWRESAARRALPAPPPAPEPDREPPSPEEIARVEALVASMKARIVGQAAAVRDRGDYAPPARLGVVPPPSGRPLAENPLVLEARREQAERRAAQATAHTPNLAETEK